MERFEREARFLAQLNRSNIATLYGLEEHDGQQFLVMELVEGETLAERIAKGPVPIDEAIPLFIQIAEGLEAAHEKAIIHRDLKPANIKIGPDGKPKILDFGLAKAFVGERESVAADSSQSPTLTKGTALGVIMGTASYMSPEQARGRVLDQRTDVWAFGCCLYEALAGQPAFPGETSSDVIVRILSEEPDRARLSRTPLALRRILQRCLVKSPSDRMRDMADVRIELAEALLETPGEAEEQPAARSRYSIVPWIITTAVALLAVTAVWTTLAGRRPPPVSRVTVGLVFPAPYSDSGMA